ncbi:hypothetical protein BDY24DRAFT_392909 [Mrakia frigida]|uniref:uncharacterized protein n=1 Tax=Mrakia frigida TaxID=29902 RepID=UPI003FCC127E
MAVEDHVRRGHPITFGVLIIFTIIEGAISTWLVSTYNKNGNYPGREVRDRSRFLCFLSWWTLFFSILYLVFFQIANSSPVASIASHGTWIIITWIMWTVGAATITATFKGGLNCGIEDALLHCGQLNALEGFAWVNWIIMTFLLVVIILLGARGLRRGDRFSGGLI